MITLKNVMRANAASCLLFGMIFLLRPEAVAVFIGSEAPAPTMVLVILGAVLLANGLHLLWAASKHLPSKHLIMYFSIGDFLWVFISLGLLLAGTWITTTAGVVISILVALMVGAFGILQILKYP